MNVADRGEPREEQPLLRAVDVVNWKRLHGALPRTPSPHSAILCYQPALAAQVLRNHPARKLRGFMGDLYLLSRTRGQVALVAGFGIGAPVTAALVEELVAFGVRRFISIGMAGGLQAEMRAGDLVVCDRAIPGDGTSPHYAPGAASIAAASAIISGLSRALAAAGRSFATGAAWTTDTPYREMPRDVLMRRDEGILTVEMEAAALFAVGQCLQVPTGAAFAIADVLDGFRWNLDFEPTRVDRGLRALFEAALQVCREMP